MISSILFEWKIAHFPWIHARTVFHFLLLASIRFLWFSKHLSLFPSEGWWRRIERLQHSSLTKYFHLFCLCYWLFSVYFLSFAHSFYRSHSRSLSNSLSTVVTDTALHFYISHPTTLLRSFLTHNFTVIFSNVLFFFVIVVVAILNGIRRLWFSVCIEVTECFMQHRFNLNASSFSKRRMGAVLSFFKQHL